MICLLKLPKVTIIASPAVDDISFSTPHKLEQLYANSPCLWVLSEGSLLMIASIICLSAGHTLLLTYSWTLKIHSEIVTNSQFTSLLRISPHMSSALASLLLSKWNDLPYELWFSDVFTIDSATKSTGTKFDVFELLSKQLNSFPPL